MNVGYHGVSPKPVFGRCAGIEITGHGVAAVGVSADPGQPALPAIFLTVETKTAAQVGDQAFRARAAVER